MEKVIIEFDDLRTLCIQNDWFTHGDNDQYERMFKMAQDGEHTIHEIALVIWICSDGYSVEEIEGVLESLVEFDMSADEWFAFALDMGIDPCEYYEEGEENA